MKAGWEVRPLGDVIDLISGQHIDAKDYNTDGKGIAYLTGPSDFGEVFPVISRWTEKPKKFAKSGDVLLTVKGSGVGKTNLLDIAEVAISRQIMAVRAKRIEPRFLYLVLQSLQQHFASLSNGAAIPGISRTDVTDYQIPLPPLEEQQRIVAVLDEAFDGLTRARAHAEANLQNARELFESLRATMLRPSSVGWEKRRLADCFRLKSGDNLTAKEMASGVYPVYGGNGIAGTHDQANLTGDNVIIGRVGALCGNARYIDHSIWLTDNAFKVVDYQFAFDHQFLTYLLNFKSLRELARQTAQPVISNSSLADLELDFPLSVDEQAQLAANLAEAEIQLETLKQHYRAKLQSLNALRQSLLQKAFAGELT